MFAAGMVRKHRSQFAEDGTPSFSFLLGVFNMRDRLASTVSLCNLNNFSAALAINRVFCSRMISA